MALSLLPSSRQTLSWLRERAPGFRELTEREVAAIQDFSLLWSYFESRACGCDANSAQLEQLASDGVTRGWFSLEPFSSHLEYFRNRFCTDGATNRRYADLGLRDNDRGQIVEAVLCRRENDPSRCIAALLIITYRLRNNHFHGEKWAYGLRDQQDNFEHAADMLIVVLDAWRGG